MRKTSNLILGRKASINDYVIKAAAMALARHPDVNVQVHGQEIHRSPHADIAIAVASPKGLVTPLVRPATRMRIDQIAGATRALIATPTDARPVYEARAGGPLSASPHART